MTAEDVSSALKKRFEDTSHYVVVEEVGLKTGYSHRRLDMIVLDCWESSFYRIDGFEIKVSTGDLRRELQDPEKHIAFFDRIDYYTLACPAGVVEPLLDVIPKKWGILIVNEDGTSRYKRKPLALEDKKTDGALPRGFVAGIIRKVMDHRASEGELLKEYERGRAAEKEASEYMLHRVKEQSDKISAYDTLLGRIGTWGFESTEKAMAEFEAFRKARFKYAIEDIADCIKSLQKIKDYMENKEDVDK